MWSFAGLAGMTVAVTVALKAPLPALPTAARALIALGCGGLVMLAFAPWRQMRGAVRRRAAISRLTADLERINSGDGDRAVSSFDGSGDEELGRLARALREALIQAQSDRREARLIHRNLEETVRRETGRATVHLRRQAHTDPLTGLGNRRQMEARLGEFFGPKRRRQHDTIVAMLIDIDRFKAINDTLGHEVGDQCLSFLGELLSSTVRREDCPIRLGGDEFAVIMPNQSVSKAQTLGTRICALFRQMPWAHEPMHRPTLSIGLASAWTGEPGGAEALLRRADRALYDAKHGGRDTVSVRSDHRSVA